MPRRSVQARWKGPTAWRHAFHMKRIRGVRTIERPRMAGGIDVCIIGDTAEAGRLSAFMGPRMRRFFLFRTH